MDLTRNVPASTNRPQNQTRIKKSSCHHSVLLSTYSLFLPETRFDAAQHDNMVDISSIIEGTVKFRDGKKVYDRWAHRRRRWKTIRSDDLSDFFFRSLEERNGTELYDAEMLCENDVPYKYNTPSKR